MAKKTFVEKEGRTQCARCGDEKYRCLAALDAENGPLSWVCPDCWKAHIAELRRWRPAFGRTPAPAYLATPAQYRAWQKIQKELRAAEELQRGR